MPVSVDELGGGGSKAWSAENLGEKVSGVIKLCERRQQRSLDTGKPETWDDGSPKMLVYIELETNERDDDEDDGVRALYAKSGRNFEPAQGSGTSMGVAIAEAVKAAGEKALEEGGQLAVQYSGIAKVTTRGYNPAKLYKASYKPPVSSVS